MEHKVYKNKFFEIYSKVIKKKGRSFTWFSIKKEDIVVIIPIIDGKILLEKHYRYPIKKEIYELPSGHVEKKESHIKAAKRELEEETGYRAEKLKLLFTGYESPGLISACQKFYLATRLKKGKMEREVGETITKMELIKISNAVNMIASNKIIDNKSIAGILYYKNFLGGFYE